MQFKSSSCKNGLDLLFLDVLPTIDVPHGVISPVELYAPPVVRGIARAGIFGNCMRVKNWFFSASHFKPRPIEPPKNVLYKYNHT